MGSSVQNIHGKVRGRMIELDRDIGLPEGANVRVTIESDPSATDDSYKPGDGIRNSAGGWSDDPEGLDAYLEWNRQQRKIGRATRVPDESEEA